MAELVYAFDLKSNAQKACGFESHLAHYLVLSVHDMKLVGFLYAIGAAVTWGMVYALDQKILIKLSPLAVLITTSVITILIGVPLMTGG